MKLLHNVLLPLKAVSTHIYERGLFDVSFFDERRVPLTSFLSAQFQSSLTGMSPVHENNENSSYRPASLDCKRGRIVATLSGRVG